MSWFAGEDYPGPLPSAPPGERLCEPLRQNTADLGWEKLRNGILLARAATEFDVFLTIDKNLKHEQNLATLPIAVVVIMASSNRLNDVLPFVPAVQSQLAILKPNSFVEVNLI